ncbi:alpha/beta hydrolase [Paeniglutamicibacter kerguelensis]|uniref:Acetyl esterase/lipase n=1 Tax=Paeniglutamicibacter kerguelensis TaxID=254788 RepID=A0ABS4XJM1_9MICC|nr:alpha/beta hydrolase [Paeniglutamicibacter kerguelensis]MBP2388664.1 acetyl esterase/lipase [Paeniglutamicibacter kerguelensis]
MPTYTAPPFDPELGAALDLVAGIIPPTFTPEMIPLMREMPFDPAFDELVASVGAVHEERTIPGCNGDEIVVSIYRRPGQDTAGPGIYHIHGGGMVIGNRFAGVQSFLPFVASHGAVIVSVEYRLAPEFPDPVPVEDCYAGLVWTAENAAELGIDPTRIIVGGASAGGGLSAGVTLLARDRQGPALRASLLIYPMLDDRNETVSSHQFQGIGVWDRASNFTGWNALLGDRRGTDEVSIYAAPARAEDLSGLPPTFIDVGSAEVFRDECVAYASQIWAAGGTAELHVWPGGFHGFDGLAPQAQVSIAMVDTRNRWLTRMLEA